jgi:uncharacterized membrane protein
MSKNHWLKKEYERPKSLGSRRGSLLVTLALFLIPILAFLLAIGGAWLFFIQ